MRQYNITYIYVQPCNVLSFSYEKRDVVAVTVLHLDFQHGGNLCIEKIIIEADFSFPTFA